MRTANHAGTAEIIAIIDRSGSMSGLEADTIEGYNALLARQSEIGPTCVTCVLFDDKVERPFAGVPAAQAKLTRETYYTRGCTALLDAMGMTLTSTRKRLSSAGRLDAPDQVIVLVITDGCENASVEWSFRKVSALVRDLSEHEGWEFLFFGANIDTFDVARHIGIPVANARSYSATPDGVDGMYEEACCEVSDIRAGRD